MPRHVNERRLFLKIAPDRPECEDADFTFTFSAEDSDLLVALVTMHHMTHGLSVTPAERHQR